MEEELKQKQECNRLYQQNLHQSPLLLKGQNNILFHEALEEGAGNSPAPDSRVFVIVQARCGSTRFKNKVLLPLAGVSMLEYLLQKLVLIKNVSGVVLATTTARPDDQLEKIAQNMGIRCVRGSEEDVLSRYVLAIEATNAKTIIRLTSDCPLHSPALITSALDLYEKRSVDYLSNTIIRTYPRGFDIEICKAEVLTKLNSLPTTTAYEREHVTAAIYAHPEQYALGSFYQKGRDDSAWRLTVDEQADYQLINRISNEFTGKEYSLRALQCLLDQHPEWKAVNQHVVQK